MHDLFSFYVALHLKDQRTFALFVFTKKKSLLGISFLLFVYKMLASQPQLNLISGFKYLLKLDDLCICLCARGKGGVLATLIITRLADE